jgi:hypothetical protein
VRFERFLRRDELVLESKLGREKSMLALFCLELSVRFRQILQLEFLLEA